MISFLFRRRAGDGGGFAERDCHGHPDNLRKFVRDVALRSTTPGDYKNFARVAFAYSHTNSIVLTSKNRERV